MNRYILICGTFLLLHTQVKAWVGGDVIRAGMFYTYAKQAKQTLIAQDAAMTLNLSGHKFLREEVEEITDFQGHLQKRVDSIAQ